jgi:hypothetical protein
MPTKAAAAEYIAVEMSRLARMANANEFALLAYLIDMAVLEAGREASEPKRRSGSNGGRPGSDGSGGSSDQRNYTRWPE